MRLALRLAARGWGKTSPNPMVGAVLVKRGRVVGKGYHRGAGLPHAEALALEAAGGKARGAVLYTNLEPCCHTDKRTPPCARGLIRHGIARVVLAMRDPNPRVSGRGVRALKQAGISVQEGLFQEEALRLNEAYVKYIRQKRPFLILKTAQSLDGKIATASGESRWISSARARAYVHFLRSGMDALMVGVGTVLRDDPQLTARLSGRPVVRQPLRVVVDSSLRVPLSARVLRQPPPERTLVATTALASRERMRRLQGLGVRVLVVKGRQGLVDLSDLMRCLGEAGVMAMMMEGGSRLNAAALQEGIVDKVLFFVTPRIMGGDDAIDAVGGTSPRHLSDMVGLERLRWRRMGPDVLLEGYTIH